MKLSPEAACELCGEDARVRIPQTQGAVQMAYYRFFSETDGWYSGPICLLCLDKLNGPEREKYTLKGGER